MLEPATKTMNVIKSTKLYNDKKITNEECMMQIRRIALRDGPRCGNKTTDKGNHKKGNDKDNVKAMDTGKDNAKNTKLK